MAPCACAGGFVDSDGSQLSPAANASMLLTVPTLGLDKAVANIAQLNDGNKATTIEVRCG